MQLSTRATPILERVLTESDMAAGSRPAKASASDDKLENRVT